uniref:Uncharacterized protein n=1 Tax=Picocystis salinarum TaxID=88271 RepID=A0A7S3UG78_9CHLO|mmetsp:Transcript_4425/g.15726  ORF Transcript_4425/g.15726 Transcript_4425/m.15726 type:complete len:269 (+) Transcript_4425:236-1042(+)|eukprot:CAMPEP_0113924044 /NCGR_PEP_ID=MMETSP1159-20121227/2461_1 /TAXON_ID=88271 /ORGANISM="Picocystis salinarum" /LENGTH=268 /DNA_ID=CAMNT_0000924243 /DNA_START=229 /DNA_END=1035 /DNA_ORIENTATION=- /assembly_acc=CAM_ASM_000767
MVGTVRNSLHGPRFIFNLLPHRSRRIGGRAYTFLSEPWMRHFTALSYELPKTKPSDCLVDLLVQLSSYGTRSGIPRDGSSAQPSVDWSCPRPLAVAPYRRAMVVVESLASSSSMLSGVDAKLVGSAAGQLRAKKLASTQRIHAEIRSVRRRRSRPSKDNGLRIGSALPISMFKPCGELPPEGKTRLHKDESCNPLEGNCQEVYHVWESTCRTCMGIGDVKDLKGHWSTCPACNGIGCVRLSSSRLVPLLNGSSGPDFTLGRDSAWHLK